ncbi:hypothetical protein LINPERPRIM_LOCUS15548 [Linum perenne]
MLDLSRLRRARMW